MRPSLNLVTLGVADLEKSIAFYRDGLGWKTASEASEGVAFFQLGPIILSLFPLEKLAEDAQVPSGGTGFSGITLAHNTRTKEEVDDVMRTAKKAGAAIMKPAQDVFWGGYSGYFARSRCLAAFPAQHCRCCMAGMPTFALCVAKAKRIVLSTLRRTVSCV